MKARVKLEFIVLLCVVTLLASCVTMTDPVPMGEGRYMLTLNAHGGFSSSGDLLTQTVKHANDFCATEGKHADILNTESGGVQMWTPQHNQVVFKCVSEKQ